MTYDGRLFTRNAGRPPDGATGSRGADRAAIATWSTSSPRSSTVSGMSAKRSETFVAADYVQHNPTLSRTGASPPSWHWSPCSRGQARSSM